MPHWRMMMISRDKCAVNKLRGSGVTDRGASRFHGRLNVKIGPYLTQFCVFFVFRSVLWLIRVLVWKSISGFTIISQLFSLLVSGPLVATSAKLQLSFCSLVQTSNCATAQMHFCIVLACQRCHFWCYNIIFDVFRNFFDVSCLYYKLDGKRDFHIVSNCFIIF